MTPRAVTRGIGVLVLTPIGLSLWLVIASLWLTILGAANLALAERNDSAPALSRSVEAFARAMGVASVVANGWGTLAPVVEPLDKVRSWGEWLHEASRFGATIAPSLPSAIGWDVPSRYLLCSLNDAELFGSGGAPLDVALVEVSRGRPRIVQSGSVSGQINPNNRPYDWQPAGGMPWYRQGLEYPFANSNFHPDFPISGANIIAAWEALGYEGVDGVLTADMVAVSNILEAVGPVESGDYGLVTSGNVIDKVLVEAYREYSPARRQAMNAQLRTDLLEVVSRPADALATLTGVWRSIPGRHVQAFLTEDRMQHGVELAGASGALAESPGDLIGVFLQSGVSKLATFQRRRIEHDVTVHQDGSANITQKTTFTNAVPDALPGRSDSRKGYLALIFRQRVAYRLPMVADSASVRVTSGEPLVAPSETGPFPDQSGGQVMWQGQDIPPGQIRSTIMEYLLPPGTLDGGAGFRYTVAASPQSVVQPVELTVSVRFEGATPRPAGGTQWMVVGDTASWSGTLDRTVELAVDAS